MLKRIIQLLERRGALTVDELARATGASVDALNGMLDTLARQGRIDWRRTESPMGCRPATSAPPVVTLCLPQNKSPRQGRGRNERPKPGEGRGKSGHPAGQSSPQ
jgi:hypothetical protein